MEPDNNPQGIVDDAPEEHAQSDVESRLFDLIAGDGEEQEEPEEEAEEGEEVQEDAEAVDEAPDPTVGRKFKVKVDGEEVEVDEDELISGYSRQSDYTRKTQDLKKQREAADQELTQARAERQQYAQALQVMAQRLQEEPQVDWDNLYKTDPIEYFRQRDQQRQRQDQRQAVQAEQMRVSQQQQVEQQRTMQVRLQEEAKLLTQAIPQWKDAGKAKAEREAISDFAVKSLGFEPQDISGISDHRVVVALRKAWLYDQAISKREKLTQPAPDKRSANPTAPKPQLARANDLKERLRKTGSEDAAAAYFASIL